MDKKKFTNTGDGAIRVDAQYDGSMLNKNGGYHKGQVNDAEKEEMNDNIAMGKGPAKPKVTTSARPKPSKKSNDVNEPTFEYGYEESPKIMKLRREGLIPNSQNFKK